MQKTFITKRIWHYKFFRCWNYTVLYYIHGSVMQLYKNLMIVWQNGEIFVRRRMYQRENNRSVSFRSASVCLGHSNSNWEGQKYKTRFQTNSRHRTENQLVMDSQLQITVLEQHKIISSLRKQNYQAISMEKIKISLKISKEEL